MSEINHMKMKLRRVELGLGVETMAKEVGLTRQQYSRIENGKSDPRLPRLRIICNRLGITLADVMRSEPYLPSAERTA